jgi:uncharacterized protein (DUF2236 family)
MSKIYLKSYLYGMGKKKEPKTMEELTKNFDKFIEGKEYDPEAKEKFEKVVKKAVPKQKTKADEK